MATKALADRFDHIVLTVNDIQETMKFYERALGFVSDIFQGSDGQPRFALRFGNQKINLQDRATDTANKAQAPTFGSGDFCLIAAVPLQQVIDRLRAENIAIAAGPVTRRGAVGLMHSVYFRDPDGNLVEVSEYIGETRVLGEA
jgi:catechol 2,3-dioxygenase-like lactoylglutathione lyase family enzyme